ncbi:MAG TPA: hypothetical protein PK367_01025 [Candidatus Paceibacterota bacterium]|nr:hypothetical protein [Candidatus Paceibacterota bacterium]
MRKLWFVVLAVAVIAIAAAASLSPPANGEGSCLVASNGQSTGVAPNTVGAIANISAEIPITKTVVGDLVFDNDTTVTAWYEEIYVRPATTGRVALNSPTTASENWATANSYGYGEATHFRCLGDTNPPYT